MLTVLASGATIVLPSGLSGPQLVEAMQRGEVTALLGVPRLYNALLASLHIAVARRKGPAAQLFPALLAISGFSQRRLGLRLGHVLFRRVRTEIGPKLRLLVSGGAALKPADERALNALGWEVLTGYGLTETSPILTFNRPQHSRIGSAGQALPGIRLRIANPDTSGLGEIQAIGASVFSRYRKDEAATSAAFTPDGWFHTGDLGYLDAESYLHVTGRLIETIILPNGKKIDPEMLESQYAADPVIKEIAIFGGATGLTALVVPDEQLLRESGTLRLRGRIADALLTRSRILPPYMRLSGFAITRTALPRTPLGKLRRHLLQPLYAYAVQQDQPQSSQPAVDEALPEDPDTVALWQWLRARYPGKRLVPDTSLQLDLGLDSLGWIDLSLALQQTFGITLTEQQTARIITAGDLLREAKAARVNTSLAATNADAEAWLAPYGTGLHILRVGGEMLLRLIMRLAFRLKVQGLEHLPAPPFVICPNHASYLDAFALAAALPHRQLMNSYFAGWTGLLFITPAERLFSRTAQIIPVDPDRAVVASIAGGAAVLHHGKTLVWFPEGRLSPDGNLQPFQPGIGAVLERQPVPVIPAWIGGTAAALPPGKKRPRFHKISVSFGPAIHLACAAPDLAGSVRQQQVADTIHQALASLALNADMANAALIEHVPDQASAMKEGKEHP
jgi:long-chain acyl-CoA synthetase